jgi:hypothetical protein
MKCQVLIDWLTFLVKETDLSKVSGSYHSLIPNGGCHYDLTVNSNGSDSKKLMEALQESKLAIAIMSKGLLPTADTLSSCGASPRTANFW